MKFAVVLCSAALAEVVLVSTAHASGRSVFEKYFDQKLTQVEGAVGAMPSSKDDTHLVDINFDLTGQVLFGLTRVLSLSVVTELDFVFVPNVAQ